MRFVALLAGSVLVACAALLPPPAPSRAWAVASASASASGVSWFPRSDAEPSSADVLRSDGARLRLVDGLRFVIAADGTMERASDVLPSDRVQVVELPDRLGGGYLWHTRSQGGWRAWRSRTWTSVAAAFAGLSEDVADVVPGFDRLYLRLRSRDAVVALDASSGESVDLGPLPRAAGYASLAFVDAWFGAVEVPLLGILVTFDAGASWRRLGRAGTALAARGDHLELVAGAQTLALTSDGAVATVQGAVAQPFGDLARRAREITDLDDEHGAAPRVPIPARRRALELAALHGVALDSTRAAFVEAGALYEVELATGSVRVLDQHAAPAAARCHGLRQGVGLAFACGLERGSTTLYRLTADRRLDEIARFATPRIVHSSGSGALVVRGSCAPAGGDDLAHCVIDRDGGRREVRVRGDAGVERAVALADGRVVLVVPPRLGAPGALLIVARDGEKRVVPISLPRQDSGVLALLKQGFWLDGMVEHAPGVIGAWVTASGPFVGARITLDGKVTVGPTQWPLEQTLLSGERALIVTNTPRETVDGGFEWRDVELPARPTASTAGSERGCGSIGCAVDGWIRVGWRGASRDGDLALVSDPKRRETSWALPGRWRFDCTPVATSRPSAASAAPAGRPAAVMLGRRRPPSPRWDAFQGLAAPSLTPSELGFDVGGDLAVPFRAYAWGPRGGDWARQGAMLVRVLDTFAFTDGVWSTARGASRWPDELSAAEAFGNGVTGAPVAWSLVADAGARAGVVAVNSQVGRDWFVVEEGRAPIAVNLGAGEQITSVVRLAEGWYFGAEPNLASLRVIGLEGSNARLVVEHPFGAGNAALESYQPRLVRSRRGDALGVWLVSKDARDAQRSWYFHALDPTTGEASPPFVLTPTDLARAPRACDDDDDGYLLSTAPATEPYYDLHGTLDRARVRSSTARMLVSERGVCLLGLAGVLDGAASAEAPRPPATAPRRAGIPMTLRLGRSASPHVSVACVPQ